MHNLIYIVLGITPSIIWLLFFLQKDVHPESNRMVLKIFFYGALIAPVAALIELGIFGLFRINEPLDISSQQSYFWFFVFFNFLGIAFVEEFLKYLVVREKVLNSPEFDEPTDAMLYMIITALGFAALENVLYLFPMPFFEMLKINIVRSMGAIFLHALWSGTVGYFLAFSLMELKKRTNFIVLGLLISTLLHGLYNISIIITEGSENNIFILIPIIMIIGLAFFVLFGFRKLKKIASVCKIK